MSSDGQDDGARLLRVAATDVEAVERRLAPQLPRRLCVVRSQYTAVHLTEVEDMFHARHAKWGFELLSYKGMTRLCQPRAYALLTRVNPVTSLHGRTPCQKDCSPFAQRFNPYNDGPICLWTSVGSPDVG